MALVAGFIAMRRSPKGRHFMDKVMLRLPVVGDLAQTAILERVCRILSSMLRAGVDLPRSMTITADSSNNAVYRDALYGIRDEMMEGQGLAGPIARTGLFPGAARQMFRVGEETGSLDQQLEVAAVYYNRELETKLERATSLLNRRSSSSWVSSWDSSRSPSFQRCTASITRSRDDFSSFLPRGRSS